MRGSEALFSIQVTGDAFLAQGTCLASNATASSRERVLTSANAPGMDLLQLGSSWWWLVAALALFGLVALVFVIYLRMLRQRRRLRGTNLGSVEVASRDDPKWVSREIERLCSGEDLNELLIKKMSAEERALFEVSIIDALNSTTREGQHRLRSALIKYGYDEQCSRRVMSQDLSDRVRATALLNLLRPQERDAKDDPEQRTSGEGTLRARAASRASGPLDLE